MVIKEILNFHQEKGVAFKEIALWPPVAVEMTRFYSPVWVRNQLKPTVSKNNYLQSLEVQVMLDTLRVIHNPLQDYALLPPYEVPLCLVLMRRVSTFVLQKAEDKIQENLYEKLVMLKNKQLARKT